ncbi:MAG: hypothetical protein FWG30_02885 [Eubacteriaceae bacterium]|nr:hypothetical protein [Eubacteriaceae bacterium]
MREMHTEQKLLLIQELGCEKPACFGTAAGKAGLPLGANNISVKYAAAAKRMAAA